MSKNDKYIPWLVVGVAGLILASLGRSIVLKSGGDNGSANLVFIIVLVGVVLAYLALIAFVTSIPELLQKLKKKDSKEKLITNAEAPEQELEEIISEANEIEPEIIKNEEIEETTQPTIAIVDDNPIIATESTNPKDMSQLRKEVEVKETQKKEEDIKLFQEYAHIVVGIYMSDKDVEKLDECIELYANGEVVDEKMKPLRTGKLENADLFHFGWNMHNFFKTGDKQAIVVDWLQTVFHNLKDLEYTTILGKLKHNERNTYMIPIVEDIRTFMVEQTK